MGQALAASALDIAEIPGVVEDYRKAAERAKAAGFDGVELHGANGYLPDEFLQDGSNKRTDACGGSIENRARFLLEVVEAMASVWGGNRVAVRIGPSGKRKRSLRKATRIWLRLGGISSRTPICRSGSNFGCR